MLVKTILNRIHKFKSFVYKSAVWAGTSESPELEIEVVERANGKLICSGCRKPRPGYDRLKVRRFEFVPLWAIKVFLLYAPRRVDCPKCKQQIVVAETTTSPRARSTVPTVPATNPAKAKTRVACIH